METLIRLSAALGIFFAMIAWEHYKPRRHREIDRKRRWPINLGLAAFNMVMMRLTIGSLAYFGAVAAAEHGWGLMNWLNADRWLSIPASILFLDFAVYYQHRLMHRWAPLWRIHQVHHTDLEFDATTAVRFHPMEILLSMIYKVFCAVLIGADAGAVIAFEIILNGAATFNHGNVYIAPALDKALRRFVITPDMHRIHHSTIPEETDSNYGFSLSCWDRWLKTYKAEPSGSQTAMKIGLKPFRDPDELGFWSLLRLPFETLRRR
ncbi:MAG: sterol desaturase family protein [Gammaproteobacteria bacterium]